MATTNQQVRVARASRDGRLKETRSRGMALVIDTLAKQDRTLSWLARKLKRSRQAVSAWNTVPEEHASKVAELTGLDVSRIS